LKGSLYERGNSLVGIYRDQDVNSSRTLTLDVSDRLSNASWVEYSCTCSSPNTTNKLVSIAYSLYFLLSSPDTFFLFVDSIVLGRLTIVL
jgi:hypothetical protein